MINLLLGILDCGCFGGAMAGASKGLGKPRLHVCANWKMSRARCEGNSHHIDPLEVAILDHLGQYSDPDVVRQLLQVQGQEADYRAERELARANKRLGELEQTLRDDLDRLDRGIMDEEEYLKHRDVRRREQEGLQTLRAELGASAAAQRSTGATITTVPEMVRPFLEDFQAVDVVRAKDILQEISKAAQVFNDGRIELEYR